MTGGAYVATGYLKGIGLSPYTFTPSILPPALSSGVNGRWLDTPSPYGPLALDWGGLAAHLTANPWLLLIAYRVLALVGLALVAWAAPRLARRAGRDPGTASWLLVASPFVMAQCVGGMHNDVVMAGLGLAALAVTRRGRWVAGAALIGLAAAIKIPGGLLGVGVVLLSLTPTAGLAARVRRTAQVGAVALTTLFGLGTVSGVGDGWIGALRVPLAIHSWLSVSTVLGDLVHDRALIQDLGVAAIGLFTVWLITRARINDEGRILALVGGLMLAVTLLSPVVHYWYAMWFLPLFACIRLGHRGANVLLATIVALGFSAVADAGLRLGWVLVAGETVVVLLPALAWATTGSALGVSVLEPSADIP